MEFLVVCNLINICIRSGIFFLSPRFSSLTSPPTICFQAGGIILFQIRSDIRSNPIYRYKPILPPLPLFVSIIIISISIANLIESDRKSEISINSRRRNSCYLRSIMAEEQRCGEGHRLCANNCGFFGSPATHNLCSKCFRDFRVNEDRADSAKIAVKNSLMTPTAIDDAFIVSSASSSSSPEEKEESVRVQAAEAMVAVQPAAANRCGSCRKKVGLTGFKCRCGSTYCGAHRYPESHACGFDYKAAGREAIARDNPLVKADKLSEKI